MWVLFASGDDTAEDGGYINLDQDGLVVTAGVPSSGTQWRVMVVPPGGPNYYLKALYSGKADALDAARRVVRGTDPTT